MVRVAVVGAGAIGLSSAINVQKLLPDAKVTIIADQFGKDTTSSGAGGLFRPYLGHFHGLDEELVKQWITDSWEFYNHLATSADAQESGQSLVTGTVFYRTPQDRQYALLAKLAYDFHQLSPENLKRLNTDYKFKENGGTTENWTIQNLADLCGRFDLVINCCGLRAGELVNDGLVYPVRGHLVSVYAPWIKHFYLTEDDVYLIPHDDKLHIGGIREKGNSSLIPVPATRDKIIARAEAVFPQLKGAKVVSEWVGLRPGRDVIRFEPEILNCGAKGSLQVIHNYGHGGHGITLSWGMAIETAKLAQKLVNSSKAKL